MARRSCRKLCKPDGDHGIGSGDMVDVTPDINGPAYDMVDDVIEDDFFVQVNYKELSQHMILKTG